MYDRVIKRLLDMLLSLLALLLLLLPMLVIALAIRLDTPGPVLFWQERVGRNREIFRMPKFRTMRVDAPGSIPTHQLTEPQRWITPVGRVLRRTSLDELPQLYSILIGKMAFVGPRPALWNQEDLVAEREKYGANRLRPGLTGWAQINGRDALAIPVKARFDGEYAQRESFLFDCRCLIGTVGKVLRRDGVVEGSPGADNTDTQKEKSSHEI